MKTITSSVSIIFVFLSVGCLMSCHEIEEPEQEVYPYHYQMNVEKFSKLRLFTNAGVIENQLIIQGYLERYIGDAPAIYFNYDYQEERARENLFFAERINESEVIVQSEKNYISAITRKIIKQDGIIYWERPDTIVLWGLNPFCLLQPLNKKEGVLLYPDGNPDPFLLGVRAKECIYLIENGRYIYMPQCRFLFFLNGGYVYEHLNNLALDDKAIISQLGKRDTFVIQESRLYLNKIH